MATLPIRQLGGVGIVTDTNPYDLPINAFSDGNNVIFDEGRVSRAPVFKQLFPAIKSLKQWNEFGSLTWEEAASITYEAAAGESSDNSRFVGSYADPSFGETVVVADSDGTVRTYPEGVLQISTPPAASLVFNEEPWASTQASGISVLSRKNMVPYARKIVSDTTFLEMSVSNWPDDATCAVVRSYKDFLIALNVTKGNLDFPTMVKWSDIVPYGSTVAAIDWDEASTTNSAGENVLAELNNPILDGLVLGTQFIIYSSDQVWLMEFTGSALVFNFRRLFATGGIINTNCAVEMEGKHFVFGADDIYVHDGSTKKSIADGRVRRRIYKSLDTNKKGRCFVLHDSIANLIYFCYNSKQNEINFTNTMFCNTAAVYNYRQDTWSFMDLPNCVGAAEAQVVLDRTSYPAVNQTYQSYNTDYVSFENSAPKVPIMLGITDLKHGLTESRVYATDLPTVGVVNLPASEETFKPAFVSREGIDLDELQATLRGYKSIRSIFPQAEFEVTDGVFLWQLGATDLPGGAIVYSTNYSYSPSTEYRIDSKVAGRYLAYKVSTEDIENFRISGFDADIVVTSKR
jgi:hypothetical protein